MKPSSRGRSGSSASAACRPGASDARRARRQPGEIDQDRARQVAQPDLPRQPRQHRQVHRQMRDRLALPPGHRAAGVDVDRHQRRRWMDVQSGTAGQVDVRLCQRQHLSSTPSSNARAATRTRSPSDGRSLAASAASSTTTRASGVMRGQFQQRAGADAAGGTSSATQTCRQPRPLAALRRAGDADRHEVALTQTRATLAVGQEPLGAVQRHEGARHRRHARDDPAAVQSPTPSGAPGRQIA